MTERVQLANGFYTLLDVKDRKDLELQLGICINGPPDDGKCVCCGRPLEELNPFSDGVKLTKTFRPGQCPNPESEEIMEEFFSHCETDEDYERAEEALVKKYGEEEAKNIRIWSSPGTMPSWECSDCFHLADEEYFDKRLGRREE
jgi:hypothetical protein